MPEGENQPSRNADGTGPDGAGLSAAQLLPLVYAELRALASARMRSLARGQTLQPTALVHEAYARLVGRGANAWNNVGHFYHSAARAMHDILVEDARRKCTIKRGGTLNRRPIESASIGFDTAPEDLLALSDALERLKAKSQRQYQLVMLRFFAGLSLDDAAAAMGVSERTLRRDWDYVRARLHAELAEEVDGRRDTNP
ncbi:MAG TPA: ECF-type sigma factor [Phycisphaerae bacterium]|nr:ECF-type sigma factor [Phycisphaerae bacterium]HRW52691.1 ECF-type sigma factor [Phycisphaerae bacterium]